MTRHSTPAIGRLLARLLVGATLTLAGTSAMPTMAIADATGETTLTVQSSDTDEGQADKTGNDGQTRATVTGSKDGGGNLAKTGDDSPRGIVALACVGGGLAISGVAARRHKAGRTTSTPSATGEHAAQLS